MSQDKSQIRLSRNIFYQIGICMFKMRYPRFTWFEVSNLNITCDFNQRYHGTLCFSWRWTGHSWPTSSAVCPRLARWRKHGCQTWCWGDYGDRTSHQQIPAAVGEAREKGFKDLATLLLQLSKPEPAHVSTRSISVAEARGYGGPLEAGFLPAPDEDQADMFTQWS